MVRPKYNVSIGQFPNTALLADTPNFNSASPSSNVKDVRFAQPLNASKSIEVTLAGIVIEERFLQDLNA